MQPSTGPGVNAYTGTQNVPSTQPQSQSQWETIRNTQAFRELISQKRAFIIPATIFFFVFYFTLPVLTAFTTVLNGKAIGAINWAYMYAFAQFFMTWGLSHLYLSRANQYDKIVEKIKQEAVEKGVEIK